MEQVKTGLPGVAASQPPATLDELRARLMREGPSLPPRLRQCADRLVSHPHSVAVSTVAEFARAAGVPASAVVRLAQGLGLRGWSDLQRLHHAEAGGAWPAYGERLGALRAHGVGSAPALVAQFAEAGRRSLEGLARALDAEALEAAAAALAEAATIHVIGLRRSFPAASYFAYMLERLEVPAVLHAGAGALVSTSALRPGDGLLAIAFTPHSDDTVRLARAARARALPVVALTDGPSSPLLGEGAIPVIIGEEECAGFRSPAATFAVVMALAVAIAAARGRA